MPEPLKRKDKHGVPYARPPEIEACLVRLEAIDAAARLKRFAVASKKSAGYVPSEVLMYFLRRAWAEGTRAAFEKIFSLLLKRVEQSLCSVVSDSRMDGARGIREEIMGRFAELIAKDCKGRAGLLDFFEIRFDKAFAAFRTSVLRQIGPGSVDTVPLSADDDEGQEISPEVEAAAADFLGGDPSKLDDPTFRFELMAAIDALPDDQRRAVGLRLQGFQIDSKDPNTMTIARMLQCDERTVRNRLNRARNALKVALQENV